MSWQRPHLAAPTRLSAREAHREIRRALRSGKAPTLQAMWRNVSASRMFEATSILSAAAAAWALAVEPKVIYRAIRDGSLPAEKEPLADGRYRWRILRSDVARFAEDLSGVVTPAEDAELERMRIEKFERWAGDR